MKKTLLLFILTVLIKTANAQTLPNDYVKCNSDIISALLIQMETELHIHIYYPDKDIFKKTIEISEDSLPTNILISRILNVFDGSCVFIEPDVLVFVENVKQLQNYPIFEALVDNTKMDTINEPAKNKYLKGRKVKETKVIRIGNIYKPNYSQKAKVTGYIFNSSTNEPLIGATIFFNEIKKGAATDKNGNLEIWVKPGKYSVELSSISMKQERFLFDVYGDGYFKFGMQEETQNIEEVTVLSTQTNKRGSKVGLEKVDIKTIKQLPALLGERDVIRISKLLPGIVSVNEASGGLNVRGGNADQNMFYINNIPLYNTSHVFGFFSALNPFIVSDFSIHKGYVPAAYGGRLSSIFIARTRKGNNNKLFMQGGVSPITASLEIEGPIVKNKGSFLVSGRSSYSDWILQKLPNPELKNSSIKFYDLTLGLNYEMNDKNTLQLTGYASHDFANMNQLNEFEYDNKGLGLEYTHSITQKLKLLFSAAYSQYSFLSKDYNSISESFSQLYNIGHTESRLGINYLLSERHELSFGAASTFYKLDRGVIKPIGELSQRKYSDLGDEKAFESSIYLEDIYSLSDMIKITGGIRYSFYQMIGPDTINIYADGAEKIASNIVGQKIVGKNKKVVNYYKPEFRLAIDIINSPFSSLKLAYNEMSQNIFLLSNSFSITPTDQWKLADYYIKPGFSRQISMGYSQFFVYWGVSASVEAYYKHINNILDFKDGADFIKTKEVETIGLQGQQDAYGVEMMISKDKGKLNGWISYTFSRSFIQIDGDNEWDKINNGNKYASNYDKPNVLNIVANYNLSRRFIVSTTLTYSTGRPITLPKSKYYIEEIPYIEYSSRNEYRIPDYFRLDLSLTIEGNLKKKKLFHNYWMIGIYNLTGRNNPYNVYFEMKKGIIHGYKYSIIAVPLFTISWNFKLGNYEAK